MAGRYRRSTRTIRRSLLASSCAIALTLGTVATVAAAPGELDDTFNGHGKKLMDPTSLNDFGAEVAIQPGDQKIVVVGGNGAGDGRWTIIRLNPDGSFDASFGGGDGLVRLDFTTANDYANAVAVQNDGKLVVVGLAGGLGGRWGIVRLNADGTLDTSFSGDGKAFLNFTTGQDLATDVVIQADQKIAVTGFTAAADSPFVAVRYTTGGSQDSTFSADGIATANLTGGKDNSSQLAVDNMGRIVVTGYASGNGGQMGIVRFRAGGGLDPSFSGDGRLLWNHLSGLDYATGVAIQPADNKIVLSGIYGATQSRMLAARLSENGTPDPSFGTAGAFKLDITEFNDNSYSVALQADGKVVLAGSANFEFFTILRLTTGGDPDTGFGDDGVMFSNLTPTSDVAIHVGIQADGNIVAVGDAGGGRIGVARFLGN